MVSVLCLYHVMALCLRRRRRRGWDVVRSEPARPDEVRHARVRAVGVLHALQGGAVRVGARGVDGVVEKRGRALGGFFQVFLQNLFDKWMRVHFFAAFERKKYAESTLMRFEEKRFQDL